MPAPQEEAKRYTLNPRVVRPEAVQEVVSALGVDPNSYIKELRARYINGTNFSEMLHPEFQAFRIRLLGWFLPIPEEDKKQYGITETEISSLGPEDAFEGTDADYWVAMDGINVMRAFVASSFYEEARRQGLPAPLFNAGLIDPTPIKNKWIEGMSATGEGVYYYSWEDLEKRWRTENPEMYEATIALRDKVAQLGTSQIKEMYKELPSEFLEKITPDVTENWKEELMAYALRTYAMFTPNAPTLLAVTNIKPRVN